MTIPWDEKVVADLSCSEVLAWLSDYLDGYLARRFNQSTRIGGLIDQAADILFMMGVIFVFVREGVWPSALLFTVMFRETLVMNLRASAFAAMMKAMAVYSPLVTTA